MSFSETVPYDFLRIGVHVGGVASEAEREGLNSFMRRQRVENDQPGPGPVNVPRDVQLSTWTYFRVRLRALGRKTVWPR